MKTLAQIQDENSKTINSLNWGCFGSGGVHVTSRQVEGEWCFC